MLINFEGVDGVGKTTQINMLKQIYPDAITTKEPGGTELGMMIRQYLINNASKISQKAEIVLFLADRAEHYAMANDDNLDIKTLIELNKFALCSDFGDKFVFLKASKDLIRQRLFNRATSDDIESRGIEYLMRVQEFISIILTDLKFDLLEIDASLKPEIIQDKIRKFI